MENKEYYRVKTLSEMLDIGQSTIYKWVADGRFPKGIQLTKKLTVWAHEDLHSWLEKNKESDSKDIKKVREALVNAKDGADHE